mgnify:CR=1 FL=1
MSGILAKNGTPEPELLLESTSKPPKITTSWSLIRKVELNCLVSISGGAPSPTRSPLLNEDCWTSMLKVILPSPETIGRILIDKLASIGIKFSYCCVCGFSTPTVLTNVCV